MSSLLSALEKHGDKINKREKIRHDDEIVLARVRTSTLEILIEDIQNPTTGYRMAPKRTSTSAAPAMTQAAIRKLVADSVSAALEAQAATMANVDNTNRNIGPREAPVARKCSYKEFMSCQPFNFKVLCPTMVPNYEKLMEVFIGGLPRSIEGNVTASKPQTLEEAITITQRTFTNNNYQNNCNNNSNRNNDYQQQQNRRQETVRAYVAAPTENSRNCRNKGPATGSNLQLVSVTCHACGEKGHYRNQCPKANDNAHGRAYLLRDKNAHQDPNVVTDTTYDIEMADGNLVGTNTIFQGCTLILLNQPFEIDLMPIKLSSFDIVVGMDWLSKYHARIICDEKVIHIPIDDETLIIRVMEKNLDEKRLEDIPVVREFQEVFPKDLPGLPLVRQVEFQIDLILGATPVARAPYKLASLEMQELSDQLQELAD
ncbi:putative reverse transcriptase domain-containing protein [Tanacetum coccineum]